MHICKRLGFSTALLASAVLGSGWGGRALANSTENLDLVVAQQAGATLTLGELHAAMHEIPAEQRAAFAQDPQKLTQLVQNILRARYLIAQAELTPEALDYLKYRQTLFIDRLLAEQAQNLLRVRHSPPDFSLRAEELYRKSPEAYRTPRTMDIRYIALTLEGKNPEEVARRAQEIAERAKSEDFDALIEAESDQPASAGTNRGRVRNYPLPKDPAPDDRIAVLAQSANAGEILPPFEQRGIFYVVRVDAFTESREQTFEEVREQIVAGLVSDWRQARYAEELSEFDSSPLQLDDEVLPDFRERYLTVSD